MRCASTLVTVVTAISLFTASRSSTTLFAAGSALTPEQDGAKPVPTSEASIKAGAAIFAKGCRSCHGLQGKGDGIAAPPGLKPANLVDAEWKHGSTDKEIFKNIKEGIAPYDGMKPLGKILSDTDIWNVINYIRSLAQPKK